MDAVLKRPDFTSDFLNKDLMKLCASYTFSPIGAFCHGWSGDVESRARSGVIWEQSLRKFLEYPGYKLPAPIHPVLLRHYEMRQFWKIVRKWQKDDHMKTREAQILLSGDLSEDA